MSILLGIMLFGLSVRLVAFTGYTGIDDITYISDAYKWSEGRIEASRYFGSARVGMIGPLAILFRLFGPNLAAVAGIPLFWSTLCIPLAYATGKVVYGDVRTALLAALFVAVFPLDVIYATQYFPDVGLAALVWVSFLCFYVAEQRNNKLLYYAAGVALGAAYLYRVTALLALLPLFLYLPYRLVYKRQWRLGYMIAAAGLLTVVAAESGAFAWWFGDPLYRAHALTPTVAGASSPETMTAGFDAVRPGGIWLSPLVSLVTNQEYGLFYFFLAWATVSLVRRRDKASVPLMLFFFTVGLYTLWGPTKLSYYTHLRPLERYMLIVTVPGVLLLARWICLCLQRKCRWIVIAVLVSSWLACIYVDNHRTFRSIGFALQDFHSQHRDKKFVMHPHAYMSLFIANGLEPPTNVAVLESGTESGYARRIDPSLEVHTDESVLSDCFVAVRFGGAIGRNEPVPPEWREVARCARGRRWFVEPLESLGKLSAFLANKLSPEMGYVIYYAPPAKSC